MKGLGAMKKLDDVYLRFPGEDLPVVFQEISKLTDLRDVYVIS